MKTAKKPLQIIRKNGYTVTIYTRSYAVVSGGRLPHAVGVRHLLGDGDLNPKTEKNDVPTMGLSLYPHTGIGFGNVCPFAKTCIASCLAHQGQGPVPSVAGARVAKTVLWYLAREWFLAKLNRELSAFRAKHPAGQTVGVRLNMFSDIPWEAYGVIDAHPEITFYDYAKNPERWGFIRPNYWVTFSYDGQNDAEAMRVLNAGGNVSVVFYLETDGAVCGKAAHRQPLPATWKGFAVIDGGESDWRPDDPRGVVIGLRLLARTYENRAAGIDTGFAQKIDTSLPILA
jgi:hypothetical protein